MLASMLRLRDVDFLHLLAPPSLEVRECALVLLRCPTGVLSLSFCNEMVNGGRTELVWLVRFRVDAAETTRGRRP